METFIFHKHFTSFMADSLIDTDLKNSFTITDLGNIHCIIITIPNRYRNKKKRAAAADRICRQCQIEYRESNPGPDVIETVGVNGVSGVLGGVILEKTQGPSFPRVKEECS